MKVQCVQGSNEYQFSGIHFVASYSGCKKFCLTQTDQLKGTMETAIKESGATILNVVDHVFVSNERPELPGYTCAYILSESHATIHTYPEVNSCFIDLFTCGLNCSYEKFDKILRQYLQPLTVNYQVIKRETDMKTLELRNIGVT